MKVLVDTCIWSMALRRQTVKNDDIIHKLKELILYQQVEMIGAVRQELLSGLKSDKQYEKLKKYLRAFSDLLLKEQDYELAAKYYNQCRQKGIQGSNTDFLICAVSSNYKLPIFTTDRDFINYKRILELDLY